MIRYLDKEAMVHIRIYIYGTYTLLCNVTKKKIMQFTPICIDFGNMILSEFSKKYESYLPYKGYKISDISQANNNSPKATQTVVQYEAFHCRGKKERLEGWCGGTKKIVGGSGHSTEGMVLKCVTKIISFST